MNKIILRPGLLPSTGVPTFWKVASGGPQHSLVVIVDTEALELKPTRQFHRSETREGGQQAGRMKIQDGPTPAIIVHQFTEASRA